MARQVLFPQPALSERCHRSLARRLVAVRRRAIFVLPEGEVDRHGLPTGAAAVLHDARATTGVGASYSGPRVPGEDDLKSNIQACKTLRLDWGGLKNYASL